MSTLSALSFSDPASIAVLVVLLLAAYFAFRSVKAMLKLVVFALIIAAAAYFFFMK